MNKYFARISILWDSLVQTTRQALLVQGARPMGAPGGPPDESEFGRLRAYLAQAGVSQAEIKDVIGDAPAGKTRAEIAELLRAWLKTRPKG